ncbi:unnamed protein product [Spodoptera exigua]|nr:unnamed protein product [Spodoptera exigua]
MENMNDKLSVKTLLFTKALPNYVIPVPVNGHKIYPCTDCGDKFIFESSLHDHVTRKSVKITYVCRHCDQTMTFYNRCNLLFHIRSHVVRTATINVTDLNVEPLPLNLYNMKIAVPANKPTQSNQLIPTNQVTSTSKLTLVGQIPPNDDCIITGESGTKKPNLENAHNQVICLECKENLSNSQASAPKDRASHYMQFSNEVFSCPVCLFALPTTCALKAHLRLHLKCPLYFCPECGSALGNKNINYPYNHDCEGFKMMRATARLKCGAANCRICFHPNDLREHMKTIHMKKVFKCPFCVVACFSEVSMQSHFKTHKVDNIKPLIFYKCELCPGKFVLQSHIETHIKSHKIFVFYPCWSCGSIFREVSVLLLHFLEKHNKNIIIQNAVKNLMSEIESLKDTGKLKRVYRVVKRCDQCQRSFTYRCQYSEIHSLPSECPYKCTSTFECSTELDDTSDTTSQNKKSDSVKCHLCYEHITDNPNEIKKHYAALHKTEKCLNAKIVLTRIDVNKYGAQTTNVLRKGKIRKTIDNKVSKRKGKRQRIKIIRDPLELNNCYEPNKKPHDETITCDTPPVSLCYICKICGNNFEHKQLFEKHLITHRDSCMAYQCMECGQSFVVKPSFSKHLLLEHNILDIEKYIKENQCYNENALIKYQSSDIISNEPLRENQCNICREDFKEPEDLAKHFRVHGMAFLMKNNQSK